MISEIQIENFKSIARLSLQPGSVTVLIGENGSGKSNILEAISFAAAASANKLDDEFLYNRGIRVTEQEWMLSKFVRPTTIKSKGKKATINRPFVCHLSGTGESDRLEIRASPYNDTSGLFGRGWQTSPTVTLDEIERELDSEDFRIGLEGFVAGLSDAVREQMGGALRDIFAHRLATAKKRKKSP